MRTFCLRPGKLYSKGKYTDLEYHISFLHSLPVFLYFSPSFSVFFAFYLYILNFPVLSFLPVFFYFSSSLSIFTSLIFLSSPSFLSSSISLLRFLLLHTEFSFPVLSSCFLLFLFFAFYYYILNFPFLSSSFSLLYFCLLRLLSFLPIFFSCCPSILLSPFLSFHLVLFSSFPIFSILILTNKLKILKVLKYKYCFCIFFWFTI